MEETRAQIAEYKRFRALVAALVETSAKLCDARLGAARGSKKDPAIEKEVKTEIATELDRMIIALWPGHQSVESTRKHLHADRKTKEDAMDQTRPVDVPPGRYQPEEQSMAFLESL